MKNPLATYSFPMLKAVIGIFFLAFCWQNLQANQLPSHIQAQILPQVQGKCTPGTSFNPEWALARQILEDGRNSFSSTLLPYSGEIDAYADGRRYKAQIAYSAQYNHTAVYVAEFNVWHIVYKTGNIGLGICSAPVINPPVINPPVIYPPVIYPPVVNPPISHCTGVNLGHTPSCQDFKGTNPERGNIGAPHCSEFSVKVYQVINGCEIPCPQPLQSSGRFEGLPIFSDNNTHYRLRNSDGLYKDFWLSTHNRDQASGWHCGM